MGPEDLAKPWITSTGRLYLNLRQSPLPTGNVVPSFVDHLLKKKDREWAGEIGLWGRHLLLGQALRSVGG